MRGYLSAGIALVALLAAGSASAQSSPQVSGWYGQISAGLMQLRDNDGNSGGNSFEVDYNLGWAITGALGYGFGNGFRAEFELGYGNSGFDKITVNGTKANLSGDIDLISGYAAGYYDFNLGSVKPYLGAGLGLVYTSIGRSSVTVGGTTVSLQGDDDVSFSAFGEVGIAFEISQSFAIVPSVRYVWVDDGGSGADDSQAWLGRIGLRFKL